MIPADWIMVSNLFHTVNSELSKGSLPTALRRVMKEKFSSFDEYQLAKYNKSIKVEHKGNQIIVIIILLKSEQITKIYSYSYSVGTKYGGPGNHR